MKHARCGFSLVRLALGLGALTACQAVPADLVAPESTARMAAVAAPLAASCLLVTSSDSTLYVGDRVYLSGYTVRTKPRGGVVESKNVLWTSSNPAVARIGGRYAYGVSAGPAVITGTASNCSGTLNLVVSVVPRPTGTKELRLVVTRFDSTTTTPVASNGILLPPGYLFERDLKFVALSDGTKEVARVLLPLAGRYPDGSLRAVLLQFKIIPPMPTVQMVVGSTHTVIDPTPWPIPSPLPQAIAVPESISFTINSAFFGPTVPVIASPKPEYEFLYQYFAEQHWTEDGAQWEFANYYDRVLNHAAYWARSGNVQFWKRSMLMALNFRTQYIEPSGYGPSPHWMLLEGLAAHYWMTGDTLSRRAVINSTIRVTAGFTPENMGKPDYAYIEGRIGARMLLGSLLTWELGDSTQDWKAKTTAYKNDLLTLQRADGSYAWPNWCGHQGNYMVGMANDALIKYYERLTKDPAIIATIKKSVDHIYASSWIPSLRTFTYMDVHGCIPEGMDPSPDLNMLIVNGFAFTGAKTGAPTYIAMSDSIADGAMLGSWLPGSKQFNQFFYDSFQWLWYRR